MTEEEFKERLQKMDGVSEVKSYMLINNYGVTFKKKGKVMITATAKRGKKTAKIKFTVSN